MTTEITPKTIQVALERKLFECEAIIERGLDTFIDVGEALLEIRDNRLYRESYSTFEVYCKERWGFTRRRASQLIVAAEVVANVNHGSQIPTTERQARPLAQLGPELQREVWQRVTESGDKITALRIQEEVNKIIKPHVAQATGNSEWYTPSCYIEAAREVMGNIDIDPASNEVANRIIKAGEYYTAEDNGLTKEWAGNVWMNPPYTQPLVTEFCDLLVEKYQSGEVKQACVLVNNATETQFYQNMLKVCSAVCFIKGRVKFIDEQGEESGAPLQGQTILYFGTERGRFKEHFQKVGEVLYGTG